MTSQADQERPATALLSEFRLGPVQTRLSVTFYFPVRFFTSAASFSG